MHDEYLRSVTKRLARGEDTSTVRFVEALCLPSFHPEVLLRASEGPNGTTFRLNTFTSSLWYSELGRKPDRVREAVPVPTESAERFWDALEALAPLTIPDGRRVGLDGMTTHARYRRDDATSSFEAWSPSPDSHQWEFIRSIYDLGWEVVREHASIERLEQLHGYLHLGLPVRLVEGAVRCMRIFGSLSSSDKAELRTVFASLPEGEPLVIDMTNFDGMATLLYPTFAAFASARQRLAWVATGEARRQVESIGLVHLNLFERVEDALAWAARP